jgi:hypothetical protein
MSKNQDIEGNKDSQIEHKWVFGVVFGLGVLSMRSLIDGFTIIKMGEALIALVTGFWYWIRYRYYNRLLISKKLSFANFLFFLIIAILWSGCIIAAGYKYWFVVHSVLLLIGIEKNIEIILFHAKRVTRLQGRSRVKYKIHKAQALIFLQYLSITRDVTYVFWWVMYGILVEIFKLNQEAAIMLFGIPYIVLIMSYWYITIEAYNDDMFI